MHFENGSAVTLINAEIDRMSESLMQQIEGSVRGELPHLKRKLRNHHKPARLFEVCRMMHS
jgi:hypothetical protein